MTSLEGYVERTRWAALVWLVGGVAFVVAGALADRRQPAFFAVGVLFFAVAVIMARRSQSRRRG